MCTRRNAGFYISWICNFQRELESEFIMFKYLTEINVSTGHEICLVTYTPSTYE